MTHIGANRGSFLNGVCRHELQAKQEMLLINGGLSQQFSGVITKLMLTNHGYSDKVQTDVTTNGESINKPTTIELVAPNVSSED